MPKVSQRRKVREAVIQILYAVDSKLPPADHSGALELITESAHTRVLHSRCKVLLHLQQGREKLLGPLAEIVRQIGRLDEALHSEDSMRAIRDLARAEENVDAALTAIRHELAGTKNTGQLEKHLNQAGRSNQDSRSHLARLTSPRPGLPAIDATRSLALDVTRNLPDFTERLIQCLSETPSDLPELSALRRALADADNFRTQADALATTVLDNLPAIDEGIAAAVENFTPERVDRVDRAILRLATGELLFRLEVPTPVVLNEAIEMAREFGTTDSPSFVNGVLDRIAKERPASPTGGNL